MECIYKITNIINNRVYIGQTNDISNRMKTHLYELRHNKHHNHYMQEDYNKYGESVFKESILCYCHSETKNELETKWCDFYKDNIYNIGETHCKNTMKQEQREKLSIAKKEYFNNHPEYKDILRKKAIEQHKKESEEVKQHRSEMTSKALKGKRTGKENVMARPDVREKHRLAIIQRDIKRKMAKLEYEKAKKL